MRLTNSVMYAYLTLLNKPGFINCADDTLSYAIYRNIRTLQKALQSYEKMLNDAVIKYGKNTEYGYVVNIADIESYNAFRKEMEPVSLIEMDVDVYQIEPGFKLPKVKTITPLQYVMIEDFLTKKI